MRVVPSEALEDPGYRVPEAAAARNGVAWLRGEVPRFCEGAEHEARRSRLEDLLDHLDVVIEPGQDPTVVLLRSLGLAESLAGDVAEVAAVYQPHVPANPQADAALERLVAACGGRSDVTATKICVLVQAYAGVSALVDQRRRGEDGPPVPFTRRIAPDGDEVVVDLSDAPFGRGVHACPGRDLALRLADASVRPGP